MPIETWLLFIATFAPAVAFPGPNAAFAVAAGLEHGPRRSLFAPLGFGAATAVHAALALAGIGAVLSASVELFQALKWIAVAYLAWLGLKHWRRAGTRVLALDPPNVRGWRIATRACAVSLGNPQAIVASALIFPLFVDAHRPAAPQFAAIGATAAAISVTVYSVYALAATAVGPWLARSGSRPGLGRVIGGFYLAAAGALALVRSRTT